MYRQRPVVTLSGRQPGTGLARLGARLLQWDVQIGSTYADLTSRPAMRVLGRTLTAILLALLLVGKWHALTTVIGENRPVAGNLFAWSVALNHLLHIAFLALVVFLVVVRRPARAGAARLSGIVAALGGSFAASFLVYDSNTGLNVLLAPIAVLFLLFGMVWAIWSLTVLGRCFSILPEVRGLVTSGPYRWVRHPVYLGEIAAVIGILLPIFSMRNVALFAIVCGLQIWRTGHEEDALAAIFPEYRAYQRRTARLLPGLW